MSVYTDTGPFAIVPEWLLNSGVSHAAVTLYVRLSRYADQGGKATPGRARLAKEMGKSVDSIDRYVKQLMDVGALTKRERRKDDGALISNEWTIHRVAARVRLGGGNSAATPSRTGAAIVPPTGGLNESQEEREVTSSANASEVRTPGGVRALVEHYYDEGNRLSCYPPQSDARTVSKMARQMLDEGVPFPLAQGAITLALTKGLRPTAIPGCVPEAKAKNVRPRKETPHWHEEPYPEVLPPDEQLERARQLREALAAGTAASGSADSSGSPAPDTPTSSGSTRTTQSEPPSPSG